MIEREILGWPYTVTDSGRVFSLPRRRVPQKREIHPVRNDKSRKGLYLTVGLHDGERAKKFFVHRLVAEMFLGPPPSPNHEVRHLDGNPINNKVKNLVWGTSKENSEDARRHGTMACGSRNGNSKLTEKDVLDIRKELKCGVWGVGSHLAKKYGVSQVIISNIKHQTRWGWIDKRVKI